MAICTSIIYYLFHRINFYDVLIIIIVAFPTSELPIPTEVVPDMELFVPTSELPIPKLAGKLYYLLPTIHII